jgi:hypothetical protein
MIVLRILIKNGHFIDALLPRAEANSIIDNWKSNFYKLKGQDFLHGNSWAVLLSEVVGMHLYSPMKAEESAK